MSQPGAAEDAGLAVPARRSFAAAVACAFAVADDEKCTPDRLEAVAAHVAGSLGAMPDLTRFGVRVASVPAWLVVSVAGARPFRQQDDEERARGVLVLARLRLPAIAEFVRLTRGLAAAAAFEHTAAVGIDLTGGAAA